MARKLFKRFVRYSDALLQTKIIRSLGPWIRHPNLWHLNKRSVAGGVAVGLASGLIPGPLQMLAATILAAIFKVNLPLALVTTFYTNPFTIVPLYVLAYTLGGMITGESVRNISIPSFEWSLSSFTTSIGDFFTWILSLGHTLVIGLLMEIILFAIVGYLVVRLGWRFHVIYEWRKRQVQRKKPIS